MKRTSTCLLHSTSIVKNMHQRFCLRRCNDENKLVILLAIVLQIFLLSGELYAVHLGDTYHAQKTSFLSLINTPSIKLQGETRMWRNSIKTWKMTLICSNPIWGRSGVWRHGWVKGDAASLLMQASQKIPNLEKWKSVCLCWMCRREFLLSKMLEHREDSGSSLFVCVGWLHGACRLIFTPVMYKQQCIAPRCC